MTDSSERPHRIERRKRSWAEHLNRPMDGPKKAELDRQFRHHVRVRARGAPAVGDAEAHVATPMFRHANAANPEVPLGHPHGPEGESHAGMENRDSARAERLAKEAARAK